MGEFTEPARRFGPGYVEDVVLSAGLTIRLRCIRPEDKDKLQQGLARVSEQTRYLRFFTAKPRLTSAELAYFTEIDGEDHFALVASRVEPGAEDDEGDGVAVGRFVRLPEEPHVAEPAIVVIDEFQGKGIGRVMMDRLIAAGKEREVHAFRSEFLSANRPVRELLTAVAPSIRFTTEGSTVTAEFPLVSLAAVDGAPSPGRRMLEEILRLVAEQTMELQRRFAMIFDPNHITAALRKLRGDSDQTR